MKEIIRKKPLLLPKPVGDYSHIFRVPSGAALIVTSVQIGTDMKGGVPKSLIDQITNTFVNLKKVLESEESGRLKR